MSGDDSDSVEKSDRFERLKAFTGTDFQLHLDKYQAERPCEACGSTDWIINVNPSGHPIIVKMDLLQRDDVMHLYLPLLCNKCGNTRFFNAGSVIGDQIPAGGGEK